MRIDIISALLMMFLFNVSAQDNVTVPGSGNGSVNGSNFLIESAWDMKEAGNKGNNNSSAPEPETENSLLADSSQLLDGNLPVNGTQLVDGSPLTDGTRLIDGTLLIDDSLLIDGTPLSEVFEKYEVNREEYQYYLKANNVEERLSEYRDSEEGILAKVILLAAINKSREKYDASPVKLDILASRVANKMAEEAALNNFTGHWNMKGEKPYHRYAFAGGVDHVSENASALYSSREMKNSFSNRIKLMKGSHKRFMAEVSPSDGHKKNVIGKSHNFAGLGYYLTENQFRYYEEYIDRYLDIRLGEINPYPGSMAEFSFKSLSEGLYPYAVVVYREPPLKKMTPIQISRKGSYPDYSRDKCCTFWPWQLSSPDENGFIPVSFKVDRSGTYYVHVFMSRKPYTGGQSGSTRGKLRASGIVFKVD